MQAAFDFKVIKGEHLLGCRKVKSKRDARLLLSLAARLELFPDKEIAVIVEHQ
jgi:hypothetical protein